jgi:hypothetical protein
MSRIRDNTIGEDLTGRRFGKYTVVGKIQTKSDILWRCLCDCGRFANKSTWRLVNSKYNDCWFCKRFPDSAEHDKRHKYYSTWYNMIRRCYNPNDLNYKNYGGRGISVCDEWRNSFAAFYDYVSGLEHFNEPGRTLDRINNDGNYCKNNVRWATMKEQANNKRQRKKVR